MARRHFRISENDLIFHVSNNPADGAYHSGAWINKINNDIPIQASTNGWTESYKGKVAAYNCETTAQQNLKYGRDLSAISNGEWTHSFWYYKVRSMYGHGWMFEPTDGSIYVLSCASSYAAREDHLYTGYNGINNYIVSSVLYDTWVCQLQTISIINGVAILSLFINGVKVLSTEIASNKLITSLAGFCPTYRGDNLDTYNSAKVSFREWKIYSRAFTEREVAQKYLQEKDIFIA